VACSSSVGIAACEPVAALVSAILMVASVTKTLNRVLSKLFAFLTRVVGSRGQTDDGRQGKSAAFGRAHVVGTLEVLRGIGNGQAIAPLQIAKEINDARAVGLRRSAVRRS
jgi:hypothetical protein